MVDYFAFTLHPLRFRMEERLGRQVMSYIFTQRNERLERLERLERAEIDTTTATTPRSIKADDAATPAQADVLSKKLRKVAKERHGATPHAVDAHSLAHLRKGVRNTSGQPSEAVTPSEDDSSAQAAKDREAIEMKKRASSNRTFIRIEIQPTTVVLSFVVCRACPRNGLTPCRTMLDSRRRGRWVSPCPTSLTSRSKLPFSVSKTRRGQWKICWSSSEKVSLPSKACSLADKRRTDPVRLALQARPRQPGVLKHRHLS